MFFVVSFFFFFLGGGVLSKGYSMFGVYKGYPYVKKQKTTLLESAFKTVAKKSPVLAARGVSMSRF